MIVMIMVMTMMMITMMIMTMMMITMMIMSMMMITMMIMMMITTYFGTYLDRAGNSPRSAHHG